MILGKRDSHLNIISNVLVVEIKEHLIIGNLAPKLYKEKKNEAQIHFYI